MLLSSILELYYVALNTHGLNISYQYVYSGEAAFKALSVGLGWARNPMLLRVGNIDKHLPMTFIYGAETWMDKTCGHQTKEIRSLSHVDVKVHWLAEVMLYVPVNSYSHVGTLPQFYGT